MADVDAGKGNIGRRVRLIVRQPNGQTSVFTGTLIAEDAVGYSVKTDFGEERTEPKLYTAVEWLNGNGARR